jgi:hypothetical protein
MLSPTMNTAIERREKDFSEWLDGMAHRYGHYVYAYRWLMYAAFMRGAQMERNEIRDSNVCVSRGYTCRIPP